MTKKQFRSADGQLWQWRNRFLWRRGSWVTVDKEEWYLRWQPLPWRAQDEEDYARWSREHGYEPEFRPQFWDRELLARLFKRLEQDKQAKEQATS
jgi:hypothetical protein